MFNFDMFSDLSHGWSRFLVIIAFIIPLLFALSQSKKYIYQGAADMKPWRNLKLWVFVIVFIQVLIYIYF